MSARMQEDLVFALQYGSLGLSLGVYLGHSVTNWLWKRRVAQLKLDWTEELYDVNKPMRSTHQPACDDLCVCGHTREEHWARGTLGVYCYTCLKSGRRCIFNNKVTISY